MARYLADSDVLIWVLRNRLDTVAVLSQLAEETGEPIACSAVSVLEIWVGTRPSELPKTSFFLEALEAIPVDRGIARSAADLLKRVKRRTSPREWVDAVIAATALHHGIPLLTYNRKDYPYNDLVLYPL